MKNIFIILVILLSYSACDYAQNNKKDEPIECDFLILTKEEEKVTYKDTAGNIVIDAKDYLMSLTDTFYTMAIVLDINQGFIGIDRQQNRMFNIFVYDNYPDSVSEGLFRIIEEGKIGYANLSGDIIIKPQFPCAYPFKNGKAKVSIDCVGIKEDEYSFWESENWFFIDKKGNKIIEE